MRTRRYHETGPDGRWRVWEVEARVPFTHYGVVFRFGHSADDTPKIDVEPGQEPEDRGGIGWPPGGTSMFAKSDALRRVYEGLVPEQDDHWQNVLDALEHPENPREY